ncbi:senescence-specific cysteine protease SAG39-like [Coffea arabica]|uniref:Senescence-specific cysteine protease SAG39-like n=1 Tax=Coffea arabica TaxID=13443 RepID=A0ABM4VT07_COFAR
MASKSVKQFFSILLIQWMVFQARSRVISDVSMIERHEHWMAGYGRQYKDTAEKEKRYQIFKANVEYIDLVNRAGNKPYKLSANQFADLTNEEFKAAHIGHRSPSKDKSTAILSSSEYDKIVTAIPPSLDWRRKGAVAPIREVSCGAWTIPAVDAVEALIKIKTGQLYTLSNQEIVDCSTGLDCYQGSTEDAFEFIKQHGLTTESNYPPKDNKGTCDTKKEKEPVAKISGYNYVPADNEKALLQALTDQPVAVMVDASGADFQFYAGGVFTGECGTDIDHGVTLVGYGTSNSPLKYWRIKNSWGKGWGEDGYMRMERDIAAKEGMCGIAIEPIYPTL